MAPHIHSFPFKTLVDFVRGKKLLLETIGRPRRSSTSLLALPAMIEHRFLVWVHLGNPRYDESLS